MKFVYQVIHGLEDAQSNFEQLQGRDVLNQSSTTLLQLAAIGTARKVAFGSGTIAWPGGSAFSNTLTLAHGLGTTPQTVQALSQLPVGGNPTDIHYVAVDATNVQYRAHTTDGSSPANTVTTLFYWLAIG